MLADVGSRSFQLLSFALLSGCWAVQTCTSTAMQALSQIQMRHPQILGRSYLFIELKIFQGGFRVFWLTATSL